MVIQKSKVVVVQETKLSYTVRIDFLKAKVTPRQARLHWEDVYGTYHITGPEVRKGEGRFVVTIRDNHYNHMPTTGLCCGSSSNKEGVNSVVDATITRRKTGRSNPFC